MTQVGPSNPCGWIQADRPVKVHWGQMRAKEHWLCFEPVTIRLVTVVLFVFLFLPLLCRGSTLHCRPAPLLEIYVNEQ